MLFLARDKERALKHVNSNRDLCVWDKEIANRMDRAGIIRNINKIGRKVNSSSMFKTQRKQLSKSSSIKKGDIRAKMSNEDRINPLDGQYTERLLVKKTEEMDRMKLMSRNSDMTSVCSLPSIEPLPIDYYKRDGA